jgi:F420-non-reducing hydrogenase large subunit
MALIKPGKEITEGLLNRIEMAWRPYDLCLACATHCLPGQTPLEVIICDFQGNEIQRLSRGLSGDI